MKLEIENDLVDTKVYVYEAQTGSVKNIYKALIKGLSEIENNYDIINPHNFPAEVVSLFSKKPKVWMCNEPEAYLMLKDKRVYKTSALKHYIIAFIKEKLFAKFFMKNAVVADEFNAKRFKKLFGYSPKIINYGVDYEFFSQEPQNNTLKEEFRDKFIILQSGMMQPLKNQMASLETVNKLKDKIPNILLILTGSMLDEEYADKIKNYIKENNLENYVFVKGHINREELRKFYYISDVLLHPIKPQGGWLTPFEFLSTGRPIVVSEEFPPKNILIDNQIGTVTSDYASAILDIYNNLEKYKDIAQNGKEFVAKNLLWDNYSSQMLEYFKNIFKIF